MSCALTLVVPTTSPPPRAYRVAEAVCDQARTHDAEILVEVGNAIASPTPGDPCRVRHHPGADVFDLRAHALADATGEIIAFLEDHTFPSDDFCAAVLRAFAEHPEADGIVGTVRNGAPGVLDRASFYLTWGPFLAPLSEVSLHRCPPPGAIAFRRSVLPSEVPSPGWLEYELPVDLRDRGRLAADDRVRVDHFQHLGLRSFPIHFHSGRGYGGLEHEPRASMTRRARLREAARLPALLVRQTREGLARSGTNESVPCMVAVGAFATCNALGQMVGVLRGPGSSPSHLE